VSSHVHVVFFQIQTGSFFELTKFGKTWKGSNLPEQSLHWFAAALHHNMHSFWQLTRTIIPNPDYKCYEADQSVQLSDVMISLAASYRDMGRGQTKLQPYFFLKKKLQLCGQ